MAQTPTYEVTENKTGVEFPVKSVTCLEDAERMVMANFPGHFVYRGGHHVALHREDRNRNRLMLIVESE